MRILICFAVSLSLTGCVGAPELTCDIFGPIEGRSSQSDMLIFPDEIVKEAAELRLKLSENKSLAGLSGSTLAQFAGTDAYSFAVALAGLRRAVAYQVAVEQAHENDGLPLVDISDEASCEMLADSIAALDQGQSAEQLELHLGAVRDHFGPKYPYRSEVTK